MLASVLIELARLGTLVIPHLIFTNDMIDVMGNFGFHSIIEKAGNL